MKKTMAVLASALLTLALVPLLATPAHAATHHTRYTIERFTPTGHDDPRLVAGWRAWRAQHLRAYTTVVQRGCFCVRRPPLLTRVRGAHVVSVRYQGRPSDAGGHGYEMDQLYRLLRRAYDHADALRVHYTHRGVPSSIYIDWSRQIADDELSLHVSVTFDGPIVCPLETAASRHDPCSGPPTA